MAAVATAAEVNQPLTTDPSVQHNPSIAVDPRDPDHVVLAYLDYALRPTGYAGIGIATSRDGGVSWERTELALPPRFDQGASDVIANFDGDGRVYVSFMAATFAGPARPPILNPAGGAQRALGFQANNGVFVSRSDDGGRTWNPPVAVSAHDYDGVTQVPFEIYPDLAVDTVSRLPNGKANPNYGNLYVTWARYFPAGQFPGEPHSVGGSNVMLAVSTDNGQSWVTRTKLRAETNIVDSVLQNRDNTGSDLSLRPGLGYRNQPRVAVGAWGDISVADFTGAWFVVSHSDDAGRSFFIPTRDDFIGLPFGAGGRLLTGGLRANTFRTVPTRAIAADPVRPGFIYVAEPLPVFDPLGNALDAADIFFARSEDYGRTWESSILPGATAPRSVNDDNAGKRSEGTPQDVTADQFMVRLEVNTRGDIGLVWYDTRRDPANHLLDVFGAVSTDAGKTFSPNFRVTDQSFDADLGRYAGATGQPILYIGDRIGLTMSDDVAYVAWTDMRAGNQDIFFHRISLQPPPPPLNDRFEPNDRFVDVTDLGLVVTRTVPKLALEAGDTDWFRLVSAATGSLEVNLTSPEGADRIILQIFDANGQQVVAESTPLRDGAGRTIGRTARVASDAGQAYYLRTTSVETHARYELELKSLTEDVGAVVWRQVQGVLPDNSRNYYLFSAVAAGTIAAGFTAGDAASGEVRMELLDARDLTPRAEAVGTAPELKLAVRPGERLVLRLTADSSNPFRGSFQVTLQNFDQYSSPGQRVIQFPAGVGPSQMAVADFNGDQKPDVAVTNAGVNVVSVALGNGDGTFSSPRTFGVGAFRTPNPVGDDAHLNTYRRDVIAADLNEDGVPDLVVTNYDSADVSVLLGRGDGTFQPQRRFDAAAFPLGVVTGDVDNDGHLDLVVIDSPEINIPNKLAVLLGRGDGTFRPQTVDKLPEILFLAVVALGDFDTDGILDLVAGGGVNDGLDLFRGVGDGSFLFHRHIEGSRQAASLAVADVDGDGHLDIVAPSLSDNNAVSIVRGKGNLQFHDPLVITDVGQGPLVVRMVDWGSPVTLPDDTVVAGPPDRRLDILIANSGVIPGPFNPIGPPGVVLLPGLVDETGAAAGFGDPIPLAGAEQPLDLEIADFDRDGTPDIAVVDRGGFFVIYGEVPTIRPNTTQATARDLGVVVHSTQPTLTIVPGHEDSWFRLQVAGETVPAGGAQVLDFSSGFAQVTGAGLHMEVLDTRGRRRGVGPRFRMVAEQGEALFVHVFALRDNAGLPGAGAYTLVIDTLPQLVTVEAPALLPGVGLAPGGPISSLVLVFQGDRLETAAAQNPDHYRVTWLGPDGIAGTPDDRPFLVGDGITSTPSVVYNTGGNRDVASGRTYPTAVRQTVTLLFAEALPAGSYRIEILPQVKSLPFDSDELLQLTPRDGFSGHAVVSRSGAEIAEGIQRTFTNLVATPKSLGDFGVFAQGTRYLTQLHSDLGALLDRALSADGDEILRNTEDLLLQIVARLNASLGPVGRRRVSMLVILLDPVSIRLVDPQGNRFEYDLRRNTVANALPRSFVEVGGNVELVVLAQPRGVFHLDIANVPPLARGGWAFVGNSGNTTQLATNAIRAGQRSFQIGFEEPNIGSALVSFAGLPAEARAPRATAPPVETRSVATGSLEPSRFTSTSVVTVQPFATARQSGRPRQPVPPGLFPRLLEALLRSMRGLLQQAGSTLDNTVSQAVIQAARTLMGVLRRDTADIPNHAPQADGAAPHAAAARQKQPAVHPADEPRETAPEADPPTNPPARGSHDTAFRSDHGARGVSSVPEDTRPDADRGLAAGQD